MLQLQDEWVGALIELAAGYIETILRLMRLGLKTWLCVLCNRKIQWAYAPEYLISVMCVFIQTSCVVCGVTILHDPC